MIRTVVCEKEGCTGNSFYIKNREHLLSVTCTHCESIYNFDFNQHSFTLLSNCSSCGDEIFKVFKDTESDDIYAKCLKCGNPPEKVFIDTDGVQISYSEKVLNEVKDVVFKIDQRIRSIENKVEALENGQNLAEESLAYITKFLTE